MLEPNLNLLKKYPDFERSEIVEKIKVKSSKLDSFNINEIDFIKIDVQGYNLQVLEGSKNSLKKCIGIEIECEFKEIYKNQSMFRQIESFLIDNNFELIDFLDLVRWSENNSFNEKLITQGEIVFVNALFIKKNLEDYVTSFENFKKIFSYFNFIWPIFKVYKLIDVLIKNIN